MPPAEFAPLWESRLLRYTHDAGCSAVASRSVKYTVMQVNYDDSSASRIPASGMYQLPLAAKTCFGRSGTLEDECDTRQRVTS